MASPVVLPRIRFFTATGEPLSGGLLHSYISGTTTPLAAYTDPAGAVPHTNPIVLDSAGEATVWLGDASAYKFVLQNAEGVVQWDVDQISSISRLVAAASDLLRADLANGSDAAKGRALIGPLDYTLDYPAGTLGDQGKNTVDALLFVPSEEWEGIRAGTSTYDATAAIQEAIDYAIARTPCKLVFSTGRYKCDSPLGYFTADDLEIDFQGSILDFAEADLVAFDALLGFEGVYGATAALTSNASANSQSLACVSTGFAVGDLVRIYSNTIWDSTRTSTRFGELNFIEDVPSGAALTTVLGLETAYTTADSGTVQKLTPVRNVHIRGGTFLGPPDNDTLIGIDIQLGLECSIERMTTRDCDVMHVRLQDCMHSHVRGCTFIEANNASQAYGVSFTDACQDCSAVGNTFRDVRHSMTTNNNVSTSWGITRRILFGFNNVYNNVPNLGGTSGDAIDTHAGADDIQIIGNVVDGAYGVGINVEARSALIRDNNVHGATASGIRFAPYCDVVAGSCNIGGNDIDIIGDSDGSTNDYGIIIAVAGAEIQGGTVSANRVSAKNEALVVRGTSGAKIRRFAITGNSLFLRNESLSGASTTAVELTYLEYSTFDGNQATGRNIGVFADSCKHLTITGNQCTIDSATGASGYGIRLGGTGDHINVSGNDCAYSSAGIVTTVGISFGGTSTYSGAWSNVTEGFGTNVNVGAGAGVASANNI